LRALFVPLLAASPGSKIFCNLQIKEESHTVKTLVLCFILTALMTTGCGGSQDKASTGNSQTETKTAETPRTESPTPAAATPTPTPAAKDGEAPVEFTYLGVAPDKETISYKIKVNTARPISQVDIGIKYMDGQGKVLNETTLAWQNVVKSARQPIEQGRTYEAKDYLPEGATKAECALKRVIFADGSRWEAN
jgi:hypothetical protein